MEHDTDHTREATQIDRWTLIRDIGVLQVKLVFDGFRDLILVPVSIIAGLISLARPGDSRNEFYELLRLGKRSERWINLFGAAEKGSVEDRYEADFPDEDIDSLVSRVESFVVDEYRKGGVTKHAKERLDKAMDSLHGLASKSAKRRQSDTDGTAQ